LISFFISVEAFRFLFFGYTRHLPLISRAIDGFGWRRTKGGFVNGFAVGWESTANSVGQRPWV